jgi:uncharacterized membrane protein
LIRKRLLAGLFSLLPLGITVWLLKVIFKILIDFFKEPLFWTARLLDISEPTYWQQAVFSLLAMCCLLFAVGTLVQNYVGRRLLGWMDTFMLNIPGVKGIYGTIKQIISAIQSGNSGSFKEVVLAHWPTPDSKVIGFVTNRGCSWASEDDSEQVVVYIPTAPNPAAGFVVILDKSLVKPANFTPEQALTWVVSGGFVSPAEFSGKL